MRGAFIVLEGCDRTGKSTQCEKLLNTLREKGIRTEKFRSPDRTTIIGKLIDQYLNNSEEVSPKALHLIFLANRCELEKSMRSFIEGGTTIIMDRYAYSGFAYLNEKSGMSLEWCKMLENGLPKPDQIYLLDAKLENMAKRSGYGNERFETTEKQKSVQKKYNELKDDTWKCIDASGTIEDVHRLLLTDILNVIESVKNKPLENFNF